MDTDKHTTKNENTYAKKEADIYLQKEACIRTYFSHSYIEIYILRLKERSLIRIKD